MAVTGSELPPDPRSRSTFELALSGGGMRAAAFSLGVLLYLVDSRSLGGLRQVSSVSGGSLTNGFIANEFTSKGDICEDSLREYARKLARRGLSLERFGNIATFVLGLLVPPVIVLILGVAFRAEFVSWIGSRGLTLVMILALLAILGDVLILAQIIFTSTVSFVEIFLSQVISGSPWVKVKPFRIAIAQSRERVVRLSQGAGVTSIRHLTEIQSPFVHVFSATDLRYGEHLHLSQYWLASPAYPATSPGNIYLHEAIRASAAFPGVLPPVRIDSKRYGLGGGLLGLDKRLVLADGGVRDNLGHVFHSLILGGESNSRDELTGYGATVGTIVVDASAPRGTIDLGEGILRRIPVIRSLPQIGYFPRVVGILSQSNSEARSQALAREFADGRRVGTVISIQQSPVEYCESILGPSDAASILRGDIDLGCSFAGSRRGRAAAVLLTRLAELSPAPRAEWNGVRLRNQFEATTLSSLGDEATARLIRHGYVLAMCHCVAEFSWPIMDAHFCSAERFDALLK